MSRRLSEREKMYFFMILFPIMWPFIPAVALCDLFTAIGHRFRAWRHKRKA
jgi:hypothetical protein